MFCVLLLSDGRVSLHMLLCHWLFEVSSSDVLLTLLPCVAALCSLHNALFESGYLRV